MALTKRVEKLKKKKYNKARYSKEETMKDVDTSKNTDRPGTRRNSKPACSNVPSVSSIGLIGTKRQMQKSLASVSSKNKDENQTLPVTFLVIINRIKCLSFFP